MVRALLGELTICVGDGCANRSADEVGWGYGPSCQAFWDDHAPNRVGHLSRGHRPRRRSRAHHVARREVLGAVTPVQSLTASPPGTEVGPDPASPGRPSAKNAADRAGIPTRETGSGR